jgi:hypothetical protein
MKPIEEIDRDAEQIESLLYRLRPGDELTVTSNQNLIDGRKMTVESAVSS